jgi:hypothetical protein
MCLFLPRRQCHSLPGDLPRSVVFTLALILRSQALQRLQHLFRQPFPHDLRPILKGSTVGHGKALQEPAAIEANRFLQLAPARFVRLADFDEPLEGSHVEKVLACGIELGRLAVDEQKGIGSVVCAAITEQLAQVGKGVAQVGARRTLRPVGPQQASQRLTAVRLLGFCDQIGQQRPDFVRGECGDRIPVQLDGEGTEQQHMQAGHGSSLSKHKMARSTVKARCDRLHYTTIFRENIFLYVSDTFSVCLGGILGSTIKENQHYTRKDSKMYYGQTIFDNDYEKSKLAHSNRKAAEGWRFRHLKPKGSQILSAVLCSVRKFFQRQGPSHRTAIGSVREQPSY